METGFNFWLGKMAAEAVAFVALLLLLFAGTLLYAWWEDRKRCPSRLRGYRCERRRGHAGEHQQYAPGMRDPRRWTDREAA